MSVDTHMLDEKIKARREAGKPLLDAMRRLHDANVPPLTEEDIAVDVKAARAARQEIGASE